MTTAEILERAAELIEPEGAWAQLDYAYTVLRQPVSPTSTRAVCWCAYGALVKASGEMFDRDQDGPLTRAAYYTLSDVIGDAVGDWNDADGRTQSEVVQALRDAAAAARDASGGRT